MRAGGQVLDLGAGQDFFAAHEFGPQRHEGALDEDAAEVGHEAHAVREIHALREGRPTLVVDEEERQRARRVFGG